MDNNKLLGYASIYCYYLEAYIVAVAKNESPQRIKYLKEQKDSAYHCYISAICKEAEKVAIFGQNSKALLNSSKAYVNGSANI